jgi:peroxiredoxin
MSGTTIGSYAPDFELPGADGSVHHLARYLEQSKAVGVVFICNHCPYVKLYLERLKQIQADFADQGFTLIGINPNDAVQFPQDSYENMKTFAIEQDLTFPYLRDETQDVALTFGAQKTPHVFLLNHQGILVYSGGIDDNAQDPGAIQHRYFHNAIAQVLAGQTIATPATEPVGCSVKWRI